jgi:hypothetical protein
MKVEEKTESLRIYYSKLRTTNALSGVTSAVVAALDKDTSLLRAPARDKLGRKQSISSKILSTSAPQRPISINQYANREFNLQKDNLSVHKRQVSTGSVIAFCDEVVAGKYERVI